MELQLKIIGSILILLALVHVIFPRYFGWKRDLKPISLINRQMMYVHTLFIALTILLMGILCVTCSGELVTTGLGHKITLGLCAFWTIRLVIQFFGYSPELWRGKRFETIIHLLFIALWGYISAMFLMVYLK